MKRIKTSTGTLYVGTAREILSLYKNLRDGYFAIHLYASAPKFNPDRLYGLELEYYDELIEIEFEIPYMKVISAETALAIILGL